MRVKREAKCSIFDVVTLFDDAMEIDMFLSVVTSNMGRYTLFISYGLGWNK